MKMFYLQIQFENVFSFRVNYTSALEVIVEALLYTKQNALSLWKMNKTN